MNKQGYEDIETILTKGLQPRSADYFKQAIHSGAQVLDTRTVSSEEHPIIQHALCIGLDGQFAIWAGTLIDFDKPLLLVADPGKEQEVVTRLARIGFHHCDGYLNGGINAWGDAGGAVSHILTIPFESLEEKAGYDRPHCLLDVRKAAEFKEGHLFGSIHIPLDELPGKIALLDPKQCYAVYCAGGYRSLIAVSLLLREGFHHVYNIAGGFSAIRMSSAERITCE